MNKKPTVIVLSRNSSTGLGVIRSLGAAGYNIDLIASSPKKGAALIAQSSKYVNSSVEIVSSKITSEGNEALLSEIMNHSKDGTKSILFPTDDYTTTIVDMNRSKLEEHFMMPYIASGGDGCLADLMDKTVQCRLAKEAGLKVAESWKVSLRETEINVPDDMIYPCYVKPIKSILGYKTEMAVCNDGDELLDTLNRMKDRFSDRDVLVQEFLDIDYEIETCGTCVQGDVYLPAMIRKTRVGKHGTGVTLTGILEPLDKLGDDVVEKALNLLRSLNYTGCFGMEFNCVNGEFYFNEINLRSAGESYAYYQSNVNLPLIFAEELQGIKHSLDEMVFTGFGKQILYDKIAWDDFMHGDITREELDLCIAESDIYILCGDQNDPEPERVFLSQYEEKLNRREKLKLRRERCIENAMELADWDRESAEAKIDEARARLGISYNDYRRNKFCLLSEAEQEQKYKKILETREANGGYDEPPLVVVLTRIYSTGLAVVRSLGVAGYEVDLVANCRNEGQTEIARASKYIRKSVEVVTKKTATLGGRIIVEHLLKYKHESRRRQIILFPTDDYTTSVMDDHRDMLEDIFIMPSITDGKQGDLTRMMSKTEQSKLAKAARLAMPQEWVISLRDGVEIPDDVIYPCFVKPIESITGFKAEMGRCDTKEHLQRHLLDLRSRNSERDILIQEFLEIEDEIDMSGVCFDQEVVIPGIIRKTMVAQMDKGVTLAGKVVSCDEIEDTMEGIRNLMKSFHYNGMFDLELNIVNGRIYFNEVNLRSGGPNFAYFMSGSNLPALAVKAMRGEAFDIEEGAIKEFGKSFIYEKVALDDYANCYISRRQFKTMLKNADIRNLEYPDDPRPTEIFYEQSIEPAERRRKRRKQELAKDSLRRNFGSVIQLVRGYPQSKPSNKRNPNADTPRVLVAGRNYCSNLSMAKSLALGGYEVEVLRIVQKKPATHNILRKLKPEMHSKYVKAFYICNSRRRSTNIVERLRSIADENNKMLIIPADDLVANVIDENYDELSQYYVMPSINGEAGGVSRLMSKGLQKELAEKAGLPVINSCVISDNDPTIPDSVNFPCFVKPNVSKNSSKSQMAKCETREELEALLHERAARGFELLVEDYIEIKRELSYLGVSTVDGVVCPGYFEAVKGGEGKHRGVALVGRMLPTEEAEPLMSDVVKFIESLRFNGLFDVDLIEAADGKVYFVELNLRYGASGYALTKCGANMPAMFADYMLKNEPLDKECKIDKPYKTFVSEKVILDEYIEGILTFDEMQEYLNSADITFIKDETDPKAFKHYQKNYGFAKEIREYNEEKARLEEEERKMQSAQAELDKIEEDYFNE